MRPSKLFTDYPIRLTKFTLTIVPLVFVFFFSMPSCDSNRHNAIAPGMTVQKNGTGQHSLGNLDKVTDPNKLVGWLTSFKDIEAEHIGFTGTKSISYPIIRDSVLLRLTPC